MTMGQPDISSISRRAACVLQDVFIRISDFAGIMQSGAVSPRLLGS